MIKDNEEQEGLLEQEDDAGDPIALGTLDKTLSEDAPDFEPVSATDSTWTEDEERRLVRKLDCLVMPLLIVAFFALQLDRGVCPPTCLQEMPS